MPFYVHESKIGSLLSVGHMGWPVVGSRSRSVVRNGRRCVRISRSDRTVAVSVPVMLGSLDVTRAGDGHLERINV